MTQNVCHRSYIMYERYHPLLHIYRRFMGVSPACPIPRNREIDFASSSFSLRAVRASEAKLHGRMQTVILIAGPPGSQDRRVVSVRAVLFSLIFCVQAPGF